MFLKHNFFSRRLFLGLLTQGWASLSVAEAAARRDRPRTLRLAFGSCLKNPRNAAILDTVALAKPDVFVWLGDNIYGDTEDMQLLAERYAVLGENPRFQALRQQCLNLAIWDDHDYGANNAGEEYPTKEASREIFLDFWQVPADDPRRSHRGIYGSYFFGQGEGSVHVILLDGRSFRSTAKDGVSGTMLGEEQWRWLEEELSQPSAVKIVCSGIQVVAREHGYEGWYEFPHEQRRLFELVQRQRVSGLVFVSGDQHWAELSKLDGALPYPAFDLTASSLDQSWPLPPNSLRLGRASPDPSFGMIIVEWEPLPLLRFQIISADGVILENQAVPLSQLSPA